MASRMQFSENESNNTWSSAPVSQVNAVVPAPPNRIDNFIQTVRHEAHLRLDAGRAEAVVAEVTGHINDAWNAHIHDGMPASVVEKEILSGFGDARRFARRLTESIYDNRFAKNARRVTLGIVIGLQAVALAAILDRQFLMPSGGFGPTALRLTENSLRWLHCSPMDILWFSLLPLVIGSFLGKKIAIKQYLALATTVLATFVLMIGFNEVTCIDQKSGISFSLQRNSEKDFKHFVTGTVADIQMQQHWLAEGSVVFSRADTEVPERWRPKGRYLMLPAPNEGTAYPLQFRRQSVDNFVSVSTPTNSTPDRAKAIRTWARNSQKWMTKLQTEAGGHAAYLRAIERLPSEPFRFNGDAVREAIVETNAFPGFLGYIVALLVVQMIGAMAGRRTYLTWLRWLWRLRTVT